MGQFELISVSHSATTGNIIAIVFSNFFNMKVFCSFSLELLHRGDSSEYTQHTTINIPLSI